MSWKNNGKDVSIIKKIKKLILKSCFGWDEVFGKEDKDHLNMFKRFHSSHIGIQDNDFPKIAGSDKPEKNGNENIIQHCMPLVNVYKGRSYSQQYSCFYWFTRHCTMILLYFNQWNANVV